MNWERYRTVMERDAIKTDNIAAEDAYFFATHMPFSQLEIYQGGRTSQTPILMNEEEVFQNLVYNPENDHRMIIVRGDNGTGKSHLIRYLKAKFEKSPSTIYNPENEQIIFLRRLNNSVRGVFSQLLEQKAIRDKEVEQKLRKFITSSDSKDESSFKNDILYAYIAAVKNDQSGEVYKPVICRDVASYLSDSRVSEFLLREGGPISRCYNVITAPSNHVLKETRIFEEEDFNVRKIISAVVKQGDPQAQDFALTLKGDELEISRLVNYLNRLTREVVQRCADISSESTKSVFEQLRRDLKKQGKNLTLFIEDFTGFTGIDSELITVLSIPHTGLYSELCRVTAIIGITNDYYHQFRDNFTDRVTQQISVTDRSYGTDDFLVQMTGRYLNAIYCDPDMLHKWCEYGADMDSIPIGDFQPPCLWETTTLGEKAVTLYPFNRRALTTLYNSLPVKSPRTFLKDVIRAQLKEYFDGKDYGEAWAFPLNPSFISMSKTQHASSIDRIEALSTIDKNRLKSVFAIWGDGSATGVKTQNGSITFGLVNKLFLEDIGLGDFSGIGDVLDSSVGQNITHSDGSESDAQPQQREETAGSRPKAPVDIAAKDYQKHRNAIETWFSDNQVLQFHADFRGYLRDLICGENQACGAIPWQDIGIPAYIVAERLTLNSFYIEGQSSQPYDGKALIYFDRSADTRDVLLALTERNYAKGWDFESSVYYQQRLAVWLEKNKETIIQKVSASGPDETLPIFEWSLALQYLRAAAFGTEVDTSTPLAAVRSLFAPIPRNIDIIRPTKEWESLLQFINGQDAQFDSALRLLQKASATTMGSIQFSKDASNKKFYRANELITAARKLINCEWNIEDQLPEIPAENILYSPVILLKKLYPRIKAVVEAEQEQASEVLESIKGYTGELNDSNLLDVFSSIESLFSTFASAGILGNNDLSQRYSSNHLERAHLVEKQAAVFSDMDDQNPVALFHAYSVNALSALRGLLIDLQRIEKLAQQETERARKAITSLGVPPEFEQMSEAAWMAMNELHQLLEELEVHDAADGNH